jgi:hypothetical protein
VIPTSGLTDDYFGNPIKFALAPRFVMQGGQGTQATEYRRLPARQTIDSTWLVAQASVLHREGVNFRWLVHLPAGESKVNFPTIPITITNDSFSNSSFLRVALKTFSGDRTSFQSTVSTQDIFQIPSGVDYDEILIQVGSFVR